MTEILCDNFQPESIIRMSNTLLLPQAQKDAIAKQQQAATAAAMPGQPPQAPPLPPEVQQAMTLPSIEEVQQLLKDEVGRTYRITIQTNSTVDVEATQDKQDVAECLNALSQFFNGLGPLVQAGAMPMAVAKQVLLSVVRRFRFGEEVETAVEQMPDQLPPQPQGPGGKPAAPGPDPQVIAAQSQADQAKAQTTMLTEQAKQRSLEMKAAQDEAEHNNKMQELALQNLNLRHSTLQASQAHANAMAKMAFEAANPPTPPQGS